MKTFLDIEDLQPNAYDPAKVVLVSVPFEGICNRKVQVFHDRSPAEHVRQRKLIDARCPANPAPIEIA